MPNPESHPLENTFRAIEAEFQARPDHARAEAAPALITMPSELEFQQQAAEREAREATERASREAAYKEWREREKREKRNSRVKKGIAVAAVFMAVKSGGLIDVVGDRFSDAGSVAAEAIDAPRPSDFIPDDEIDGIEFKEYPQAAQDEMKAEGQAQFETADRARETVIDLFKEADADGYDSIVEEVSEERRAHPELYMDEPSIEAARERIDEADSNKDAIKALGEFLDFYGIEAGFHDEPFNDREGSLKTVAGAFVDVLSVLPKDFVALAELERVTISNHPVSDMSINGASEMGTYSPSSNAINIVAAGPVTRVAMPLEGVLERSELSYQGIVAHEFGHALDEQLAVDMFLPEGEEGQAAFSVATVFEHIGRGVINRPEAPSIYAKSADEEYSAELKSGVLSDRSDGLASTNEWRRFGSGSNKAMIETLFGLEKVYPGIAKILVANRAN